MNAAGKWVLVAGLAALTSFAHSQPQRFEFALITGAGLPVCDAYVQQLNRSEFANYPFCDRPPTSEQDGFSTVTRVPLSATEVERIYDDVASLIRGVRVRTPGRSDAPYYARENEARVKRGIEPMASRLEPSVDIDTAGRPDDVTSWKQIGLNCGERYSPVNGGREDPVRAATHLVVLDAEGKVDAGKTKAVFGHPAGNAVNYLDAQGREQTLTWVNQFRTLGYSYGAFVHDGVTYFDTFYGSTGDFTNSRVDEPGISDLIAVMKRENQTTMLVCEIRWESGTGK